MKYILVFLTVIIMNFGFGQVTKKENISRGLTQKWEISNYIEEGDTIVFFYWSFQNMNNKKDKGSIIETSQSEVQRFAELLIEYGTITSKQNKSDLVSNARLDLYDNSNKVFIEEHNGKKTCLSKKKAVEFGQELLNYYELIPDTQK